MASYVFYGAWYWEYSFLILSSTLVDYFVGIRMADEARKGHRKMLLAFSLIFNLGLLSIFKYFNFFSEVGVDALSVFGFQVDAIRHEFLLPVGISFYTFQTLSYTIDVYRGNIKPERSFLKFAVFVSFFPQLVAGPIVRASDFLPQLHKKIKIDSAMVNAGLFLIFCGLVKKILIADSLALLAIDDIFENPEAFSSLDLLIALYAYALQIYCDFSGYSDIAIGVALMLGFRLPINFNRPYLAKDPSEFWTRWHISLSTWLRDYLYISLGGNRRGPLITKRNLFITMLLGGLWHGASMNFILWGAFHGLILMLFLPFRSVTANATGIRSVLLIVLTFHLILFGWLLFRVQDMQTFTEFVAGFLKFDFDWTVLSWYCYALLIVAFVWHFIPQRVLRERLRAFYLNLPVPFQAVGYSLLLVVFSGLSFDTPEFLYFQF
ncbi:MBOAT family O-acyltransferase [Marinobacter sp. LN3S78]|uniref:MBOAT family O-acyltransferase n=1 Tax=Marinobacter sp. LN3S78 TaxID=3382300 RepID=UPI00387ACBAC